MAGTGVIRGGYHFLQAGDGAGQADYFYSRVKEFLHGSFIAQLDFESESSSPTLADAWAFKNRWYALTGRRLFVYLPQWYANKRGFKGDQSGLGPLWASHYYSTGNLFTAALKVPGSAWGGYLGWDSPTVLQFSDAVSVANDSGLDGNIYRGSFQALAALADTGVTEATTPSGEGDELGVIEREIPAVGATVVVVRPAGVAGKAIFGCDFGDLTVRVAWHNWMSGNWSVDTVTVKSADNTTWKELPAEVDKLSIQRLTGDGTPASVTITF